MAAFVEKGFSGGKGAVKLHLLLDHDGYQSGVQTNFAGSRVLLVNELNE